MSAWVDSATGYTRVTNRRVDGHITRLAPDVWGVSDGRSFSALYWTRHLDFDMADAAIASAVTDPPAHLIGDAS